MQAAQITYPSSSSGGKGYLWIPAPQRLTNVLLFCYALQFKSGNRQHAGEQMSGLTQPRGRQSRHHFTRRREKTNLGNRKHTLPQIRNINNNGGIISAIRLDNLLSCWLAQESIMNEQVNYQKNAEKISIQYEDFNMFNLKF